MAEWIYFLHPPRDDFAATMTDEEQAAFADHSRWLAGLLGGHMDRDAHKGADERGVPRWIWNAHHAMFDDAWLAELLQANGFTDVDISCYDIRNLRCYCRRART